MALSRGWICAVVVKKKCKYRNKIYHSDCIKTTILTRTIVVKSGYFVQCDQRGQDLNSLLSCSFNLIITDLHCKTVKGCSSAVVTRPDCKYCSSRAGHFPGPLHPAFARSALKALEPDAMAHGAGPESCWRAWPLPCATTSSLALSAWVAHSHHTSGPIT